jgi:choice-of-anchor C domain-containing protein
MNAIASGVTITAAHIQIQDMQEKGADSMKKALRSTIITLAAGLIITFTIFGGLSEAAVVDGDFSNPTVSGNFTTYGTGSNFGAWQVTSGSIDLIGNYWQKPPLGGQSVDMDGLTPGAIRQDIGDMAAGNYKLTFYLSGNPDGSPTAKELKVMIGSTSWNASENFTFDYTGHDKNAMGWIQETLSFTSTGGDTVLTFCSLDSGSPYGPAIGNVAISAVPEPATVFLFGSGLLGFIAYRLKFNKA